MALHEPATTSNVNDAGLPELSPYQGLEHNAYSEQKEYYGPGHQEKEFHSAHIPLEVWHGQHAAFPHTYQSNARQPPKERAWWKRKRILISLAALVLIGAVAGGVAGGLSSRKHSSPTTETSNILPDPGSPSIAGPPSPKPLNSSLASVAWTTQSGELASRRLYYQDDAGVIKESTWNSSGDEWYSSNENLGTAKLNSPIAAAVAGNKTWPFQISMYYLDPKGRLVEKYTTDGEEWDIGRMTNEEIIPARNSALAATWSQSDQTSCNDCGEQTLLFAYQDSNNKIWVFNATDPPIPIALKANAKGGTSLAMNLVWYHEGSPRISVYYQTETDDLVTADWEGSAYGAQASGNNNVWTWNMHEDTPVGRVTSGGSIASFASDSGSPSGDSLFSLAVTSGPQGINTTCTGLCSGIDNGAQGALKDVQPFSAVAANADRHVYAFEDGKVKEFVLSTDGTWSLTGDVPIVA
ncbi:MAG: hypothetical protein Q9168_005497 [Polycauliona sp. 1 TL-2023]